MLNLLTVRDSETPRTRERGAMQLEARFEYEFRVVRRYKLCALHSYTALAFGNIRPQFCAMFIIIMFHSEIPQTGSWQFHLDLCGQIKLLVSVGPASTSASSAITGFPD